MICLPEIEYEINGVECVIRVTHYMPEDPSVTDGPPDNWYEGSPAEIEYEVLHIDGTDAPELERAISGPQHMNLRDELIRRIEK